MSAEEAGMESEVKAIDAKFQPGDRVRVRDDPPPGHHRTPAYVQGLSGTVVAVRGAFRNPESLAYGEDGLPTQVLYTIRFDQRDVWPGYGGSRKDGVCVDIYEHWLDPG